MAQGDSPNINETKFDDILKQLYQIKQKSIKDGELLEQLRQKQLQRAQKQKDQQEQKKSGKVLKKLPTVLTTNERKRYQEIGKRFMLGAEQQFRQVKKGIKMKQMMKTSKDFFLKKFDKVKEENTRVKKKSFWKTLLGSLIVIGLAAALFKDKIVKMMPDLSQKTGGIFKTIVNYIGNMLKGCWQFITKSIGGSISGIFYRIFTDSIPNILSIFFHETLPVAIFNTYLAIMSQFDETANSLMHSGQHDSQTQADINSSTAEGGELDGAIGRTQNESGEIDALNIVGGLLSIYGRVQKNQANTQQQLSLLYNNAGKFILYTGWQSEQTTNQVKNLIGMMSDMMNVTQEQFRELVSRGEVDVEFILRQFLLSKTRDAQALAQAMAASGIAGGNVNTLIEQLNDADGTNTILSDFRNIALIYSMIENSVRLKRASEQRQDNRLVLPITQQQEDRLGQMYDGMGYISLKILQDATVAEANKFLQAANNFVGNGDITTVFKNQVNQLVTSLGTYFNNFFTGTLDILKGVLYGVLNYTNPSNQNNSTNKNVVTEGQSGASTALVVNVDLTGNEALSLSQVVSNLVNAENNIVSVLQNTNSQLTTANAILNTIGEMHGLSIQSLNTVASDIENLGVRLVETDKKLTLGITQNTTQINRLKTSNEKLPYKQRDNDLRQTNYAFL